MTNNPNDDPKNRRAAEPQTTQTRMKNASVALSGGQTDGRTKYSRAGGTRAMMPYRASRIGCKRPSVLMSKIIRRPALQCIPVRSGSPRTPRPGFPVVASCSNVIRWSESAGRRWEPAHPRFRNPPRQSALRRRSSTAREWSWRKVCRREVGSACRRLLRGRRPHGGSKCPGPLWD